MKTLNLLCILFSGLTQFSVFSQQNWEIKAPPVPTSNQLVSLYFVDAQTGWAAGEAGTILKTTDAGITWRLIEIPWLSYLRDIYFPTSTVGYAVGENGFIIKSNDAGESWWLQPIRFTNNLQRVRFRNENVGWIIGEKGLILHTANGGATWEQQLSYCRQNLNGLALAGNDNVWVVGQDTTILMSSDEGQNWQAIQYQPEGYPRDAVVIHFKDCYFLDANQGWIGGIVDYTTRSSEILINTTNGGISWTRIIINSTDYLEYGSHASGGSLSGGIQQIYFADPQNGYCLTGDLFTKWDYNRFLNLPFSSKDGGKNWRSKVLGRREGSALAGRLAYLGPDRILATGYRGDFRITTNQGATWGFTDAARRNFQDLIIGNEGRLYGNHFLGQNPATWSRSDDYGQTWVTFTPKFVNPTGALPPNLVLQDPGNFIDHHQTLYTCCGRSVFKSIDCGRTWQLVRTGMHADLY
ncbi:YCF48-related protein [candidate division KSB1 bacterium]|nr:YCF48-related protein [candidate division KSB1 bacterium]